MLPSPKELKKKFPLSPKEALFITECRNTISHILLRKKKQLLLIVGPCSVDQEHAICEYAEKLKEVASQVKNVFCVLRFFIEKPRTILGWGGFLTDPDCNQTYLLEKGLFLSRKILLDLAKQQIPCAMEFLHPFFAPFFEDLISWGVIGSRTSSSTPHRQLASSFSFPVGFKNDAYAAIDMTLQSIVVARASHFFPILSEEGRLSTMHSKGNLLAHLILRGTSHGPNYDRKTIEEIEVKAKNLGCFLPILVDCAHGNSSKNLQQQEEVFRDMILQKNKKISGLMLESYLFSGRQELSFPLQYGISLTDPCLGWEETKKLILWADSHLSSA